MTTREAKHRSMIAYLRMGSKPLRAFAHEERWIIDELEVRGLVVLTDVLTGLVKLTDRGSVYINKESL